MSDLQATVTETKAGFHVEGYEKIEYDFTFLDGVFHKENSQLADCFARWKRCLAIMDLNIFNLYGQQLQDYFSHYNLELKVHKTMIGEKAKSMDTLLSIVDSMNEFGKQDSKRQLEFMLIGVRNHSKGTCTRRWRRSCYRCYWVVLLDQPPPKMI